MASKIKPTAKRLNRLLMGSSLQALKSTIRKGLNLTQRETVKIIRRKYAALPASEVKAFITVDKRGLKARTIGDVKGKTVNKSKPISFIRLVRGSKEPRKQKNVPIKSRDKVKVRLRPGKTVSEGLFIARVTGGGNEYNQVFRRVKKTKGRVGKGKAAAGLPIQKQSLPAIQSFLGKPQNTADLVQTLTFMLGDEFRAQFLKQIDKRAFKLKKGVR